MSELVQFAVELRLEPVASQGLECLEHQIDACEHEQSHTDDRQKRGQSDKPILEQGVDCQRQAGSHEQGEGKVKRRQGKPQSIAPPFEPAHLVMDVIEPLGREVELGYAAVDLVGRYRSRPGSGRRPAILDSMSR